jgi:twitching motility protein PilT
MEVKFDKDYLNNILVESKNTGASDTHITTGIQPFVRVYGDCVPLEAFPVLTGENILSMAQDMMDGVAKKSFIDEMQADFAYVNTINNIRYRVNVYRTLKGFSIVLRQLNDTLPKLENPDYPSIFRKFLLQERGLVLVCGPTGSGKTTTLSACIDYINRTQKKHIITIEDPVEYTHQTKMSLVDQREVGRNVQSFAHGLKAALREDPDIILIGEMRDRETIKMALSAAETGHLVFGTLHTMSASKTIDRIIDSVETGEKETVKSMLATSLNAIILQTLLKRADKQGRIVAFEILVATSGIRNMIRESKVYQIDSMIQTGSQFGMCTMDDYIASLVQNGKITKEEAMTKISHPDDAAIKEKLKASPNDISDFADDELDSSIGGDFLNKEEEKI